LLQFVTTCYNFLVGNKLKYS